MSNQFGDTRIDDDLTLLSETLEEVLRSSGDPADQKYVELKARAEKALDDVKKRVSQASDSYYYRAKQAVYRADDYVHEKPWQGIGVGAAVGLVLGLLLARQLKASKASLRGKGISITRMPGVAGISCDKWRSRFSSAVVSDCTRTSPC